MVTPFDFDGDTLPDLVVEEVNHVSGVTEGTFAPGQVVRSTAGFHLALAPGVELYSDPEVVHVTFGSEIGPTIPAAAGTWSHRPAHDLNYVQEVRISDGVEWLVWSSPLTASRIPFTIRSDARGEVRGGEFRDSVPARDGGLVSLRRSRRGADG